MIQPLNTGRLESPISPKTKEEEERLGGLDNLRAIAMLLGVFLHASIAYYENPLRDLWAVSDHQRHLALDVMGVAIHSFRMQLFFLVAGFFAHLLKEKLGLKNYLKQRFKRILLPLLLCMPTIVPLLHWQWGFRLDASAPIHLWFLVYLTIYYSISAIGTLLCGRYLSIARKQSWDSAFEKLVTSPWKPIILTIPSVALMLKYPIWNPEGGVPGQSLIPGLHFLGYYGLFFLFGWCLHRQRMLLSELKKHVGVYAAFGFIFFATWLVLIEFEQRSGFPLEMHLNALLYLSGCLHPWLIVFSVLGLFLRYFPNSSKTMRYLSTSSYWVYLMHLPLVIFLQGILKESNFSAWAKFSIVSMTSMLILLVTYEYCVRRTWIGLLLNGKQR